MWYFIPSKWEFIALWCLEHGEPLLAKKAMKIEEKLKEIYSNTLTEDWVHDFTIEYQYYTDLKPINIYDIASLVQETTA